MCNTCDKSERLDTEWDCLRVQVVGNNLEIGYDAYSSDSSFSTAIVINYCPICGEKITSKSINNIQP
jgi:hypothetical protein